ncbi:SMI1/KNR4 family protein [Actinomadura kijaniata]|uniref:SMI1/KNR4 family protein n=1 Tax=Actinomadura kijaniata TaxID=46161 RepID=UPI00082DB4B1|nr:SMI1/KNR4 family protein [Actinomadura kijaniata]
MKRGQWRPFLERWSREWVSTIGPDDAEWVDPEVIRDRWLGFAPADEPRIAAAERRIGRTLPPSFREFLAVTDGWRRAGEFVHRLAGADGIGWLRDMDRTWIEDYGEAYDEAFEDDEERVTPLLERALQISLEGDATVMFLDPEDVDEHGEWAAYRLSSWSGGPPHHHGSFAEMMRHEYASFHRLRKPRGETRDHWTARVEQARRDALAGQVDGPLKALEEADGYGVERAGLLRVQMTAFLHEDGHRPLDGLLLPAHEAGWIFEDPLFEAELLPLLFAAERTLPPHGFSVLRTLMRDAPEPVRLLIADHQARLADPGFRPAFGPPDFDRAIRAVVDGLAADPAFQVTEPFARERRRLLMDGAWPNLAAALPLWRPVSEHHIAPVVLLADPVLADLITPEYGRRILATPR